jgi:NifU-like protein involved in Fe-S cluster formation
MDAPTASGEYFSDSCGDMYNFFLKIGPGAVIEDISYFTTGCGFGTATCSLVVELAKGKTIDEASGLTSAEIEAQLDGYPEKKKDYPERALEALKVAIADYRTKVESGAVPDYATMPREESVILSDESVILSSSKESATQPPANGDGKVLIRLH